MGKKKSKNEQKQSKNENKDDGGKKEAKQSMTVVLKVDLHCEGCASKVMRSIRGFEGVESVKCDDADKLTVIGNVDPAELRETVEQKIRKKVQLVSPLPKKDKDKDNNKGNDGGGDDNKKKDTKEKQKEKPEEKKSKEPPVTTAVMKLNLHCEGCIHKIHRVLNKTKGFREVAIDRQKDLVTVKGSMDMKALAESLKKQLKKDVQIVPPKKEGEKKEKGGGGGGGDKEKGGGEGKSRGDGAGDAVEKLENKFQYQFEPQPQYPYAFGPGHGDHFHAPQMFSDENPNACTIM
ncbi:unnamed protein product [Ilex paraguariensis]|uniref:HMA domain-containing protein n=1 Tax=Ilex paraguariensis TaxID=185542 RepID=A0ABC8TPP9_9AQUA